MYILYPTWDIVYVVIYVKFKPGFAFSIKIEVVTFLKTIICFDAKCNKLIKMK